MNFVGREDELAGLERLYQSPGFQMVVVYGRRRIGKTTLIDRFVRDKDAIYFTAQQRSSSMNLRELSGLVFRHFGVTASMPPFSSWSDAFEFIASNARGRRLVFVFDEFPYAAHAEPGIPSALQVSIDRHFRGSNVFMILCGSNEGFMESEVLGRKSPLYGRRTSQIHLLAFDYFDTAKMIPGKTPIELVNYYATFGGTPYYLAQLDPSATYGENVARLMFDKMGLLYEEPLMLLRQKLREPALYNSILSAIASGATEPSRIGSVAGIEGNSVGKYLKTLAGLGLIERRVPFSENPSRSRRSLYYVADPFFAFWYQFVEPAIGAIERGAGIVAARQAVGGQSLPSFVGRQFERIALQYVARRNRSGGLPFLATSFGSWWGTDPTARETVDIDLIAANKQEKCALFAECKWRNSFDETAAMDSLEHRARLVKGIESRTFGLFTKYPIGTSSRAKAEARGYLLVSADDLYE